MHSGCTIGNSRGERARWGQKVHWRVSGWSSEPSLTQSREPMEMEWKGFSLGTLFLTVLRMALTFLKFLSKSTESSLLPRCSCASWYIKSYGYCPHDLRLLLPLLISLSPLIAFSTWCLQSGLNNISATVPAFALWWQRPYFSNQDLGKHGVTNMNVLMRKVGQNIRIKVILEEPWHSRSIKQLVILCLGKGEDQRVFKLNDLTSP